MGHKSEPGKILENVSLIEAYYFYLPKLLSLYVVKGDKTALIDTGVTGGVKKVIDQVKKLDLLPLDYIIITHEHWDHIQGTAPLLKTLGEKIKVLASKPAQTILEDPTKIEYEHRHGPIEPVKKVTPLSDGEVVDLGGVELQTITVPGHTPGHIALYEKASRNIFVGDCIGYKLDETTFLPPLMPPWFNKEQFYSSVEKLRKINFDTICMGHYGLWDGSEAKNMLSEAKQVFDNFWNFMEKNRDMLDDVDYLKKSLVQRFLSKSKVVERVGEAFAGLIATQIRDGFKYSYKPK